MKKILDLYFSPVNTFKHLNEKPDWIIPVVITLVVVLMFSMIALPRVIVPEGAKRIMSMEQLTPEQKDKALSSLEGGRLYIFTPISITFVTFLFIFLKTGVFFLIFSLFGARTIFMKLLSVVSYAFLTGIPETILKSTMMLIKGSTKVFTSLALFAPNLDFKSPLFKTLSKVDIFTIWNLALISLGCTVIYNIPKKKSFGIVFGFWVLWLLLQFGLAFVLPKHIFFG